MKHFMVAEIYPLLKDPTTYELKKKYALAERDSGRFLYRVNVTLDWKIREKCTVLCMRVGFKTPHGFRERVEQYPRVIELEKGDNFRTIINSTFDPSAIMRGVP